MGHLRLHIFNGQKLTDRHVAFRKQPISLEYENQAPPSHISILIFGNANRFTLDSKLFLANQKPRNSMSSPCVLHAERLKCWSSFQLANRRSRQRKQIQIGPYLVSRKNRGQLLNTSVSPALTRLPRIYIFSTYSDLNVIRFVVGFP